MAQPALGTGFDVASEQPAGCGYAVVVDQHPPIGGTGKLDFELAPVGGGDGHALRHVRTIIRSAADCAEPAPVQCE